MTTHTFNRLTPEVWWLSPDGTTDRPVLGAVAGRRGTLVIDAGNSPAHAEHFKEALAREGLPPPAFLALTHWHWDHVFGTASFDVPSIASTQTQQTVTAMANLDWSDAALDARVEEGCEIPFCRDMMKAELPDRSGLVIRPPIIGFQGEMHLDLGGITAHLIFVGGDHAPDSIIVSVPEARVAFLSDALYPAIYAPQRFYTAAHAFRLTERILALPADIFLTGHHPEPLPREEMLVWSGLLQAAGEGVLRHPTDRDAAIAEAQRRLTAPIEAEELAETVDEFLAGIDQPG